MKLTWYNKIKKSEHPEVKHNILKGKKVLQYENVDTCLLNTELIYAGQLWKNCGFVIEESVKNKTRK